MILNAGDNDTCEVNCIHQDLVRLVRAQLLDSDETQRLAALFKVMGDPTRVRIIQALSLSELCVCDLVAILGMNQSAVSHQLRVLRQERLVQYRKAGKMVFYSLDDTHIINLFREGLAHISHT